MKVFIVYCHPGEDSVTCRIKDNFIKGLKQGGHDYIISDLYKMNFKTDMSGEEYFREAYYRNDLVVPDDVLAEQEKINSSDVIAFIFPLFWSEAPAKLVGWFDRVWTYGFAYGNAYGKADGANRTMKKLNKALVMISAGNTLEYFEKTGIGDAIKKIFLDDRLFDRAEQKEMIIFDATSREKEDRDLKMEKHLKRAFDTGKNI